MSDVMDPSKLKVAELRAELQARGLDTKGNKPVLVERLREALEEEAADHEEGDEVPAGDEEEEEEEDEQQQQQQQEEQEEENEEAEEAEAEAEVEDEEEVPASEKEPEVPTKKSDTPAKKAASPQKAPEPSPRKQEAASSRKGSEPQPSIKTEPEDSAKLGYEDAPMEELGDAGNGMDTNIKEEMEIKQENVEVKQEETEEPGSTSRRGEKRPLSRSRSPETAPEIKKQRPEVEEVRIEDEPDYDKTVVALDWYNSDLSLVISKEDYLSAQPLTMQGFGYVWHGVRATYGFTRGRVFFEAKVEDYLPVPQLEEEEQHPHVLRVGWSVDDAGLTLGEDPFSYGYGGTAKASTNLKFKDYGKTFGKGDVLGCFVDLESEPVVISFTVNGQHQGMAYSVSHSDLGDQALFPHVVTKNASFRVNFGSEPAWMEPLPGYTFTGHIPLEDRILGTQGPEKREEAEVCVDEEAEEAIQDATPDATQDATPDATPDATQDATPDDPMDTTPSVATLGGPTTTAWPAPVEYDSDSAESVVSIMSEASQAPRQRRKVVTFTTEQEADLAEWLQQHPYLFDKGHPEYRNKPLRDRVKAEKAAMLEPPSTGKDIEKWLRGMRTRFGKLSKAKSGDGATKKTPSDRDRWILQLFQFMGQHIQRCTQPKTLGPKQSAISAVAATEQAVPGPSAAPSAPLAPAPRSSAAAAAAATLAESTASASAASLILDKFFEQQNRTLCKFMADSKELQQIKAAQQPPPPPQPQDSVFMTTLGRPLCHLLEASKIDAGFSGQILGRILPIIEEYKGRNYDEEVARDRARMRPPTAPPRRPPASPVSRQLDLQSAPHSSTPRHDTSSVNVSLTSLLNYLQDCHPKESEINEQ